MADLKKSKKIKYKDEDFEVEPVEYLLITAIKDLTDQIKILGNRL